MQSLATAAASPDTATQNRMKLLAEAEKIFLTDLPLIPIYHYVNLHMNNPKLTGWYDNLLGYNLTRYLAFK